MSETKYCTRCAGNGMLWADGKAHYPGHRGAGSLCPECGGAGHTVAPDPRIAAADEMAKALAKLRDAVQYWAENPRPDEWILREWVRDMDVALAAWNALK